MGSLWVVPAIINECLKYCGSLDSRKFAKVCKKFARVYMQIPASSRQVRKSLHIFATGYAPDSHIRLHSCTGIRHRFTRILTEIRRSPDLHL